MSAIGSILNIARTAIQAHQTSVRVASLNIANAQTEGYSRQRVQLASSHPEMTPYGRLGGGVRVADISRVRDFVMDSAYHREVSRGSGFDLRHQLLGRVETMLGEPSDLGLSSDLDAFFASWSDLANQPTNETARGVVVQRARQVADRLQYFDGQLRDAVDSTRQRLNTTVSEINRMAEQIATVNSMIVEQQTGGSASGELEDQRDRLLDSLSKLTPVRVLPRPNGAYAILVENTLVVDGGDVRPLNVSGNPPVVSQGGSPVRLGADPGPIGEMLQLIETRLPAIQQRLDTLANALVSQTNAIHSAGFLPDGTPAGDFFDPDGVTAGSIRVAAQAHQVAAGDAPNQPGNNRIALAIAGMRGRPETNEIALGIWTPPQANALGGVSIADYYRVTVVDLAGDIRVAEDSATVHNTLAHQADLRRQSVSGVSTDEELIRVMQHQQAYQAAARLITVVDEMMQTVLDMKR